VYHHHEARWNRGAKLLSHTHICVGLLTQSLQMDVVRLWIEQSHANPPLGWVVPSWPSSCFHRVVSWCCTSYVYF